MGAWIKMPLDMEQGLGPGDFVLDGDPASPSPKRGGGPSPIFGPFLMSPNGWMHQDAIWYGGRPQPGDFVLDGDAAPLHKKEADLVGRAPQFSAHVYCGQTAGWINMALGIETGLGPVHIVLDGDTAPLPKKGAEPPPQFSAHPYCGQTAGCIKMPLDMEVGLSQGTLLDRDAAPFPKRRRTSGAEPPNFRPMSIVAKRLHGLGCLMVCR